MCAIFGAVLWGGGIRLADAANNELNHIAKRSLERGRDGQGWEICATMVNSSKSHIDGNKTFERNLTYSPYVFVSSKTLSATVIGNMRAEPTTEWVRVKSEDDQQPYSCGKWSIVHNGTIANDQQFRTHSVKTEVDSAAIVELLDEMSLPRMDLDTVKKVFANAIARLRGSYAILAYHMDFPGVVFTACNYRPIWYAKRDGFYAKRDGFYVFASSRSYFSDKSVPQMQRPYSLYCYAAGEAHEIEPHRRNRNGTKALVVCSGGLDSVVAATAMQKDGYDIELLHFRYGSRAQEQEERAVSRVAEYLGCNVRYMPMDIYCPQDSPLLRPDSGIAGGQAGAEFAFEWVPARNLVMLSLAIAYAEAKGFDFIALGNNLEEAGAYPDNEPEFISRINDLLPFAVADGVKLEIVMPVGNLMKHEIVDLGTKIKAPLHLTWSCYRNGEMHCGQCGPCHMRKTAFAINGIPEVINYERY